MTQLQQQRHPRRRPRSAATAAILIAASSITACSSAGTTEKAPPTPSATIAAPSTEPATDSDITAAEAEATTTAPAAQRATTTSTTQQLPLADIQALLDTSLGPDGIEFNDAGVPSPASTAVLGIRIPGHPDTILTSGTNLDGDAPDANQPFLISRISRTLVEAAAWQLVDNGTLDPSATLSTWLPDYPNAGQITVEMLLDETAGMADFYGRVQELAVTDPSRRWTLAEVLDIAALEPPLAAPGTFAQVPADSESIALAYILEQITAQPIGQLVRTLVTEPLDLRDTGFAEDSTAPTNIQTGTFVIDGKAVDSGQFIPTAYYTLGAPSWGAYSTPADLLTLIEALSTGTLLGQARAPGPEDFTDDRVATDGALYIAQGDPMTGYCPCEATENGHRVTAFGRRGSETGTTIATYHFPTTGITMVLHYNASPATTSDLQDLLYEVHGILTEAK